VLLEGLAEPLSPACEAMIFSAARIDHLDRLIRPALARGAYVICDRFADSTRAYQGATLGDDFINKLESLTVGATIPDLTLILDLPAEEGLARANARRGTDKADRFESETIDFHRGLREAFLTIAKHHPQRCLIINASRSADEIAQEIWTLLEPRLIGAQS
jgi:dTMP kinase